MAFHPTTMQLNNEVSSFQSEVDWHKRSQFDLVLGTFNSGNPESEPEEESCNKTGDALRIKARKKKIGSIVPSPLSFLSSLIQCGLAARGEVEVAQGVDQVEEGEAARREGLQVPFQEAQKK